MALAKPEISMQIPSFDDSCQAPLTHVIQYLVTIILIVSDVNIFVCNGSVRFQMMSLSNDVTESNFFKT